MGDREKEQQSLAFKRLVPYICDFFTNTQLQWPSLACRWGPEVEGSATSQKRQQLLYLSEQTDGSEPNKLLVVTADVLRPRVSGAEAIASWSEQGRSPFISKPNKTILHPGEVNKLKELPQRPSVVVTHTDSPQLFVWDLDSQPDRAGDKGAAAKQPSSPDLTLEGHEDDAEFALGVASAGQPPLVASGGKDTMVLVWNLADYVTSLATPPSANGGSPAAPRSGATLQAQLRLEGHTNTVEDVVWQPGSGEQLASCGDDHSVLLWDTRSGKGPVLQIPKAHQDNDVHCVDWSPHRLDLLVSGGADGSVKVWDRRNTAAPAFSFELHTEAITRVEWSPHRPGVFASGADDRLVCLWDLDAKVPEAGEAKRSKSPLPPQLLFQHAGHKSGIVDLQWNPLDPWTLLSVSDDAAGGGGGTLQLWRVHDFLYRPDEEVLQELEQYRDYIISGNEAKLKQQQSLSQQQRTDSASELAPANGTAGTAGEQGAASKQAAAAGGGPAPMDTAEAAQGGQQQQQQQAGQEGEAGGAAPMETEERPAAAPAAPPVTPVGPKTQP